MKKILFCAVAMAAALSCSDVKENEIIPNKDGLREVTIEASTPFASRATIDDTDDNWTVKWEAEDALLSAATDNSNVQGVVNLTAGAGSDNATFEGTAPEGDYRLVYPSTADLQGTILSVDLSDQIGGEESNYIPDAKSIYMVSETAVSTDDAAVCMKQLGAVLDIEFSNIGGDFANAVIVGIDISGFNSTCEVDLTKSLSENYYHTAPIKKSIVISEIVIDIKDGTARARLNILPTTLESGDKVVISILVNVGGQISTLTQTKQISRTVELGAAKHHIMDCSAMSEVVDYWSTTPFSDTSSAGTAEDPIEISSAGELAYLAERVNGDKNYNSKHFKLMDDIDLGGYKWKAIGTAKCGFKGTFDGNNKTISGLYINEKTKEQGLFGYAYNEITEIKNVTVSGSILSIGESVGGVVGRAASGKVTNCHNRCYVSSVDNFVGGVVGYTDPSTVVDGCSNSCFINGKSYVGGIVGSNNGATVKNSHNTGSVTGSGVYVGGVVGYHIKKDAIGYVENCYNTGEVKGTTNVGGVVGYDYEATITNCHNTGVVTGTGESVGGVVGYYSGDPDKTDDSDYYDMVESCYNTGDVNGATYVGGVVGGANAYCVINCYNTGSVAGTGEYVGGVLGHSNVSSNSYLRNSYNRGSVSGKNYIGGINGVCQGNGGYVAYGYSKIENIYSSGSVTSISTDDGIRVGGIIGSCNGGAFVNHGYWDTSLLDENENGCGFAFSDENFKYNCPKTKDEMTNGNVLDLLNGQVAGLKEAKQWIEGTDGYPTLDL